MLKSKHLIKIIIFLMACFLICSLFSYTYNINNTHEKVMYSSQWTIMDITLFEEVANTTLESLIKNIK